MPGIAAIVVVAVFLNGTSDTLHDSPIRPSVLPITVLTDLSESEVQAYRVSWAEKLNVAPGITIQGVAFTMIPPGEFSYGEEEVAVRLDRGFYLSESEVTIGQFKAFAEAQQYTTVANKTARVAGGRIPPLPNVKTLDSGTDFLLEQSRCPVRHGTASGDKSGVYGHDCFLRMDVA